MPPHPTMRLPAHSQRSARALAGPFGQGTDSPTLQASKRSLHQDKTVRPEMSPQQSGTGKDKTHSHGSLHAVEGSVSLPLYNLYNVPAHPMLASAFTQGAPAAQDFPSFHQGPLSFNLLPFQRKGNRISSLVFPIPDVSSRKDTLTGSVATLLKTQHDSQHAQHQPARQALRKAGRGSRGPRGDTFPALGSQASQCSPDPASRLLCPPDPLPRSLPRQGRTLVPADT